MAAFEVLWIVGQDGFDQVVLSFNQNRTSKDRGGDVPGTELATIPDVVADARGDGIACSDVLVKGGDGDGVYLVGTVKGDALHLMLHPKRDGLSSLGQSW